MRCGDYGGLGADGSPCGRTVSEPGKCNSHSDVAEDDKAELKAEFLELFAEGSNAIRAAAAKIGVGVVTVWRWRQQDPEFDTAMVAAQVDADAVRVALAEDSLFNRIVGGTASAAETIFFLKNRAPKRWHDVREQRIEHSGEVSHAIRAMSDEEILERATDFSNRLLGSMNGADE